MGAHNRLHDIECLTPLLSPFVSIRRVNLLLNSDDKEPSFPVMSGRKVNIIANVTERVSPAVVAINLKGSLHFDPEMNVSDSSASGFIVHPSGLILTSAHVVANASVVSVTLFDGQILTGRVEFVDATLDLALVRLETSAETFPYIKLGDTYNSSIGDWVIAIGNPKSMMNTISVGVISSLRRKSRDLNWDTPMKDIDFIQTDAATNPGSSGGPLLNLDGEAIGIHKGAMDGTHGIAFAIPSNYAKEFIERTNRYKQEADNDESAGTLSKRNRYIGISMLSLTPELIDDLKLRDNSPNVKNGILVWKVMVGSPAHQKGLKPGDIITHINHEMVSSVEDVYKALDSKEGIGFYVRTNYRFMNIVIRPQAITV
ncbi:unnamed protein product [Medioppia subpectinata]|uniref:Serine protease HTRA2, mitochondrial n=1 Tax=Medioppia subpectinata TaxID=1979941 RepID=A0A7R9KZZ1_9ACAR|nr:unnamed protein product [Medioppia subpectinata]CAG2111826.1 unnamed protein product [Medioppia subpectinata]